MRFGLFAGLMAAALSYSCGSDSGGGSDSGNKIDDKQIVVDVADKVIVPTYADLKAKAGTLLVAAEALKTTTNDVNLTVAKQAWKDARVPWERSEGFLFGPVDSFGYDPTLDSWPVDKTGLDSLLAGSSAFTTAALASMDGTLKGFHTIEYLLFGADGDKAAAVFTSRELDFLVAATTDLSATATLLHKSWSEGVEGQGDYYSVFVSAGDSENTSYPSVGAALQELANGIIGICDEVANGKIADPYDNQDGTLVESQFAHNSIADFTNNLKSIENVYLSKYNSSDAEAGFGAYLKANDAVLDSQIRSEIAAAISALGEIAEPFGQSIKDDVQKPKIEAAQEAILQLHTTLNEKLLPLVQ